MNNSMKREACSTLLLIQFRADVGTSQQAAELITVLFNSLNVALLTIHLCMPSRCNTVIIIRLCYLTTLCFITDAEIDS